MPDRDFFGFCTSLKRLELKAIGELSRVRHLVDGETLYSTGDLAHTIFIINRGAVEVVQPSTKKSAGATYLSRGDIVGDVETLTNLPRKHLVRACEPVSLQCFERKDFAELIRRVPSFFEYLSEQLAFRLSQANDLALAQSHCLELSGSLSNFDLITIYQTITNSSQTGELRIWDDESELISAFFFEKGQPRWGQFEHLTGEEAFWQLFVDEKFTGKFSFSAGKLPAKDWIQSERIARNAGEMLINALQGRDEFDQLKQQMPDGATALHRSKANFSWPIAASPELQPVAKHIWELTAQSPLTISALFRQCSVCELKVYQVVDELIQSRHFVWSEAAANEKVA
ncbi:MAG: cyclic nucleotide-binding domain-containing protein [Verrucomicrobiaceae bacterium]|nr:cyclic nucleotide-binding domain-containing protein [Verrucomicrobiaceae bacterium]